MAEPKYAVILLGMQCWRSKYVNYLLKMGDVKCCKLSDSVLNSRLKNRHPVKYGRRISAVEEEDGSFCLHIRMVECTDAGYYACKAINEYGTKQCEAKLDIQGIFGNSGA